MDKKINKSIRINEDLVRAIEERASSDNRTFSNLVTMILEDWSKKENKAA